MLPALKFFVAIFISVVFFLNPSSTQAQIIGENVTSQNWNSMLQINHMIEGSFNAITCIGAAIPIYDETGCATVVWEKGDGGQVEAKTKILKNGEGGGAMGVGTTFVAQLYNNQPASGVQYLARNLKDGFGIGPDTAYAQGLPGTGGAFLSPVEKLWQVSRNISYLFFIVIFVVIGFMIMLRQKINPQTVISVQNALPGLVVGLILVTFSYFISGLIIDIAFLGSQVIGILFLTQAVGSHSAADASRIVRDLLDNYNFFSMFWTFMFSGHLASASLEFANQIPELIVTGTTRTVLQSAIGALAACFSPIGAAAVIANPLIGIPGCALVGGVAGGTVGNFIISGLIVVVLFFGLAQALVRLGVGLITAFVTIVLTTIFSPFIILFSAIPGQGKFLASWWKVLLANSLIFPVVFGMFFLVAAIIGFTGEPWQVSPGAVGDFKQTLPLFGGSPVGFIQLILAYGLLLVSPGIPDLVKDALGARTNQIIQQQFGKNLGVGVAAGGLAASTLGYGAYRAGGGGILGFITAKFPQSSYINRWGQELVKRNLATRKK